MPRNPRDDSTQDATPRADSQSGAGGTMDERLAEVLLQYMEQVESGSAPDPVELLAAHPELATELQEFFSAREQLEGIAPNRRIRSNPVRTPAAAPTEGMGRLGDFRLIREIGRGGMGVVYEAEQLSLGRRVALKVLPFAASFDPRSLQRFQNEARAAACLHHSNIVPVFAVGNERGTHYYAMQFIDGQSLSSLIQSLRRERGLDEEVPLPTPLQTPVQTPSQAGTATIPNAVGPTEPTRKLHSTQTIVRLIRQAAEALEHAHQTGIIHRDIKPGNLLLDPLGQLWVTDFGLAVFRVGNGLTQTGEVVGTIRYASPEQVQGKPGLIDHRTDIYSLGATLYEWLTLHAIFEGNDREALLRRITQDEPFPPRHWDRSIPTALETIILKALAKSPGERYATAQEFADDLGRFLNDQPILAQRPNLLDRAMKWSRRHRGVVATTAFALVVGVIGLGISTALVATAYDRERDRAQEAETERQKAEIQRQNAEASLRDARKAVDLFTELTEQELSRRPEMDSARRRVLEAAILFYQDFIDRHQDNPTIQQELEDSRARLQQAIEQVTLIQGVGRYRLLNWPPVQEDLQLSSAQLAAARRLDQTYGPSPELYQQLRNRTEDQRRQAIATHLARYERELQGVLTLEQQQRLQEIALQTRGPMAVLESPTCDTLGLTAQQRQQIRDVIDDAWFSSRGGPMDGGRPPFADGGRSFGGRGGRDGGGPGRDGGPPRDGVPGGLGGPGRDGGPGGPGGPGGGFPGGPFGGMRFGNADALMERVLEILSPKQQAIWKTLVGQPFRPIASAPGIPRNFPKGP
ncbi:serine/threonine protein kinase [Tuwongella immobilis]|uniref:Protein kinase domain-containing protein n=1 Tax=Tuwongella immobilis TaxID=692036 RepID=A0A6C2YIU0_9BACT|nr:serine/threonine-protein kinase [Tuwongella immobilis]VIP01053.1 serine threonine protein kinase : Serine/threonine protein kinase OS=Pirellula staleyi (strain ATCC 27377 / DSM 6068 / ICPB 4128) GN=Psta_3450 PE=3 SV=1: Pkinase: Pkinase [Tuwongella immobilis]VTR97531.1 serine threonine protein kinase : Serine/threonine protein kinase OS=Pirellula staleyi (strain ATCC 27377 / DSM 6068 / ICPB 4128) GN=Psta_3450 PE=3 SV=1: Pkinase: Pkinase [Tuwongella immobilis]